MILTAKVTTTIILLKEEFFLLQSEIKNNGMVLLIGSAKDVRHSIRILISSTNGFCRFTTALDTDEYEYIYQLPEVKDFKVVIRGALTELSSDVFKTELESQCYPKEVIACHVTKTKILYY
jgi:hypothetical protein